MNMSQIDLNRFASQYNESSQQSTKQIQTLKWNLNQRGNTIRILMKENQLLKNEQERLKNHLLNVETMEQAKLKNLEELYVEKLKEAKDEYNKKLSLKERLIQQLIQQLNELEKANNANDDTPPESPRKKLNKGPAKKRRIH